MKMNSSLGVNLRVTGHCNQGDRKYMEDMFCVAYQQTEDGEDLEYAYFGIFDGHGGKEAAVFARERLMEFIVNEKKFWSDDDEDVLSAIKCGYLATHNAMWKELATWPKTASGLPSTSGTTATIAFIRNGKLYIGHVGDSSLVLGYQESPGRPHENSWLAKPLTQDHKPESEDETNRIERSGGKVKRKSGVHRVVWNRPRIGHKGPVRRSTPIDEIPFLSVARSLGDLWSYNFDSDQFVVSPEPDVRVLKIDTSIHRCLIFGTDGFWNMISPTDAVLIAQEADRRNESLSSLPDDQQTCDNTWVNPSKRLVDRALCKWNFLKIRADNTSVVTLFLNPPCSQGGCQMSKTAIVSHSHETETVAQAFALVTEPLPGIPVEAMLSPVVAISPLPIINGRLPSPALQDESEVTSPLNDLMPNLSTKHTFGVDDFRNEKAHSGSDCTSRTTEPAVQCGEIDSSTSEGGDTTKPNSVESGVCGVDECLVPERPRPEMPRPDSVSPVPNPIAASTPAHPFNAGGTYARTAVFREKETMERRVRINPMRGVLNAAGPSDKNVFPLSCNVETNSHFRDLKRRHSSSWERRNGSDEGRDMKRTRSEDKAVFAGDGADLRSAGSDSYNPEDTENERLAWPASWLSKMRPCTGDVGSEENAVINCSLRRKKKWIRTSGSPLNGLRKARPRSNGHIYLDRRDHSRTLRSDTTAAFLLQRRTLRSRNVEMRSPVKVPVLASKGASAKRGVHVRGLTSEHSSFSQSSLLQTSKSTTPSHSKPESAPRRRARSTVATHPK